MRFIIYGAGGVGGVLGAELHKAGIDAILIARGGHLDVMRSRGLRYQTPSEDVMLPVTAVRHPGDVEFGDDDVVILTMKSQHTQVALDELRAVAGDRIPVICCQNGVANERSTLRRFPRVYAMSVFLPAQFIEPGLIQCHASLKSGILDLGIFPSGIDMLATEISQRLDHANFSSRADPKVMRFKYAKLLMNLGNGIGAISQSAQAAGEILTILQEEGRACFEAAGLDYASDDEVRERRRGVFEFGEIHGVKRIGGSSQQSLVRGTGDIETDYLNGEIVQLGRLHGVATPANAVIQRLANSLARRKGAPGGLPVDRLTQLIAEEAEQSA